MPFNYIPSVLPQVCQAPHVLSYCHLLEKTAAHAADTVMWSASGAGEGLLIFV